MSTFKIYGTTFHVDRKYTPIRPLGRGAYGVVCSAKDKLTKTKVAIKRISPMSANEVVAKQALREIRLMRHLGRHSNVVTLVDLGVRPHDDELYLIMELMDTDLHRIIQSQQALTDAHHKHFMYQLIRGVRFAHRHGVIHRDLKPSNLLVTKNCDLRITDFGLSRLAPEENELMTEHVVTRWYRPPELMLCADGNYTAAVDMWSVGCIFAELLGRKPLFPGKNFMHQLCLIFEVIGTPAKEELAFIKSEQAMTFMRSLNTIKKTPFKALFPYANPKAVDLLERMLVFTPAERIGMDDALNHPYFASVAPQYTDPEPELDETFEFEFEKLNLSKGDLKRLIVKEVQSFKAEMAARRGSASSSGKGSARGSSSSRDESKSSSRERRGSHDSGRRGSSDSEPRKNGSARQPGYRRDASSRTTGRGTSRSTSRDAPGGDTQRSTRSTARGARATRSQSASRVMASTAASRASARGSRSRLGRASSRTGVSHTARERSSGRAQPKRGSASARGVSSQQARVAPAPAAPAPAPPAPAPASPAPSPPAKPSPSPAAAVPGSTNRRGSATARVDATKSPLERGTLYRTGSAGNAAAMQRNTPTDVAARQQAASQPLTRHRRGPSNAWSDPATSDSPAAAAPAPAPAKRAGAAGHHPLGSPGPSLVRRGAGMPNTGAGAGAGVVPGAGSGSGSMAVSSASSSPESSSPRSSARVGVASWSKPPPRTPTRAAKSPGVRTKVQRSPGHSRMPLQSPGTPRRSRMAPRTPASPLPVSPVETDRSAQPPPSPAVVQAKAAKSAQLRQTASAPDMNAVGFPSPKKKADANGAAAAGAGSEARSSPRASDAGSGGAAPHDGAGAGAGAGAGMGVSGVRAGMSSRAMSPREDLRRRVREASAAASAALAKPESAYQFRSGATVPRPFTFATSQRSHRSSSRSLLGGADDAGAGTGTASTATMETVASSARGVTRAEPRRAGLTRHGSGSQWQPTAPKPFTFSSRSARERGTHSHAGPVRAGASAAPTHASAHGVAVAAAVGMPVDYAARRRAPAADIGADLGAVARAPARRKRATVPKSPNFSKMSWERRGTSSRRSAREHDGDSGTRRASSRQQRSRSAARTRNTRVF